MNNIFFMRANPAQNAKDRLHKKGRLDDASIGKMRQRIEMPNIIAFNFKAGLIFRTGGQDIFNILKGVFKDQTGGIG